MVVSMLIQRATVNRRRRKLAGQKVNEAFVGSWF